MTPRQRLAADRAAKVRDGRPIHCKHWDGRAVLVGGGKCKVGIDPRVSFCDGDMFGMVKRIPCIQQNDAPKCHLADYPTREEVDAAEREFGAYVETLMSHLPKARAEMVRLHKETGAEGGAIDCPQCGVEKSLAWSRSNYNGHIRAQCATDKCMGWME